MEFEYDYYKNLQKFLNIDKFILVRVECSDEIREKRGWKYDEKKDKDITECSLDNKKEWDIVFRNDEDGDKGVRSVVKELKMLIFQL